MALYHVIWEIHIDSEDSVQAAREAKRIMLDPKSIAKTFYAKETYNTTKSESKGYTRIELT